MPYMVKWEHEPGHVTVLVFNSLCWAKVCAYAIFQDNALDSIKIVDCNDTELNFLV
jgi:hypothetical protein